MIIKTGESVVGRVSHYYPHINVGIIELTDGDLSLGDIVHIKGSHTDFVQPVVSMQLDHESISLAEKGKVSESKCRPE